MRYKKDPYEQDIYSGFFFTRIRQTVYKWWCVVYKPVYKLTHHGHWPEEKEPGYVPPKNDEASAMAAQMANQIMNETQNNINQTVSLEINSEHNVQPVQQTAPTQTSEPVVETAAAPSGTGKIEAWDDSVDTSGMSDESVDLAKEIMARLAREAAEDEAKKQAEIDKAKQAADEKARLDEIMRSNQVDISQYIEEGRAHQNLNN